MRAPALLAADVGGTHARVALVQFDAAASTPVEVLHYRKYVCAEHAGLEAILQDFLAVSGVAVRSGAIACAGYVRDGAVLNANLPWAVQPAQIRRGLGLRDLAVVNDFEAVAHATPFVPLDAATLMTGAPSSQAGPVLVIGPGTGLGAAVRFPGAPQPFVLASEAGHATLAPGTPRELEIVGRLLQRMPRVSNEHLLSGPGLVTLYACLCELRGEAPRFSTPAQIAAAAQDGGNAAAVEALDIFCGLLGSVVGDLVLTYGAHAGVYLAGGIPAQIKPFLLRSSFVERFLAKDPLRPVLATVPVWLIDHGQLGVIGAASWYAARAAAGAAR